MQAEHRARAESHKELTALRKRVSKLERAEQTLQESEEKWRSLAENAPNFIIITDAEGSIQFSNRTAPGYRIEETLGKTVYDFLEPAYHNVARTAIKRLFQKGEQSKYEARVTVPGGNTYWYETHVGPIKRDGKVTAATLISTDIGARKKAEQELQASESKYRNLVEGMTDVIFIADAVGTITSVNKAVKSTFGWEPEEVIGKNFTEWLGPQELPAAKAIFERMLAGEEGTGESIVIDKQNKRHNVEVSATPILEAGKLVGIRTIIRDITERTKMEEALRESETRFRTIYEAANLLIMAHDKDFKIIYMNPCACSVLGYEQGEMIGKHFRSILEWTEWRRTRPIRDKIFVHPDMHVDGFEQRIRKKDKGHVWISWNVTALKDASGKVVGILSVGQDMTERKEAEQALKIKDKAIASSINAIAFADPQGNLTYANNSFLKMWGYENDKQVIGRHASKFWQDETDAMQIMESVCKGEGWVGELTALRHDGSPFDVQVSATVVRGENGVPICMMGSFVDVSERKKAAKARQKSEERWRSLAENAPDVIMTVDPDGTILFVNHTVRPLTPEKVIGMRLYDFIKPEYRDTMRDAIERVMRTGEPCSYELAGTGPDGRTSWYQSRVGPIKHGGQVVALTVVATDMTEHKQCLAALQESENKYRTLLENLPQQIFLKDKNSVYVSCNENYAGDLNIKAEEIAGKTDYDFYPTGLAEKYVADDKRIVESRQTETIEEKYIRQGEERIVHTVKTPVRDEQGDVTGLLGIFWDITEYKQAQDRLDRYREETAQAERLASLGTLSATLAHELTQPLTVVRLSIENALADLETTSCPASATEGLEDSLAEITHTASIINRLRNFARKSSKDDIAEVDLKAVAERITQLLDGHSRRVGITVRLENLDSLPSIFANEKDMEQLFFALVENAIHAAEGKKKRHLTISAATKGRHVELQFSDNCGGIASANIDRIFEPFFTTKLAGEGTGLGLCIVQRIVSHAGGKIRVESKAGKGSTFFVTLPIKQT